MLTSFCESLTQIKDASCSHLSAISLPESLGLACSAQQDLVPRKPLPLSGSMWLYQFPLTGWYDPSQHTLIAPSQISQDSDLS